MAFYTDLFCFTGELFYLCSEIKEITAFQHKTITTVLMLRQQLP